ncbi:MAG: HAMP domain-containing sensor histidine kinase [Oleiphilaceae bacterium]|nr:HAMP domain-containing sensor histidine kinase [Oleiphilaceae bacterium]
MSDKIDFSTVIASAVHDMKNSLGMLLHSVDELRTELPDSIRNTDRFNTLQYEAQRVHGDLVQLLSIYRLDQKTLSPHIEEQSVAEFLEEQLARHQPLLDGMGLEVTLDCQADEGYFDANLIAGILNNTINNALRYTRRHILVSARHESDYLVISVQDDGQGFPEHMQDSPLDTQGSVDFANGNTQLGLFFADQVARMHREGDRKGFIRLNNTGKLGGGNFELWLP